MPAYLSRVRAVASYMDVDWGAVRNSWKSDLTGKTVIVRSNEANPLRVGTCTGYTDLEGKAHTPIPMVEFNRKKNICMGIVVEYSNELAEFLENLSPKEQYKQLLRELQLLG